GDADEVTGQRPETSPVFPPFDPLQGPTVLPSIVQDETRVFSSSTIEKLVFIAPLRPRLNHRCSHNFVVSSLGTAHPIPSQAADLLSNIS
ncbi:hypothetical protein ALC53_03762, partial [Atta colombica]